MSPEQLATVKASPDRQSVDTPEATRQPPAGAGAYAAVSLPPCSITSGCLYSCSNTQAWRSIRLGRGASAASK